MKRAVILAATPDSLTVVGGLPLAVRAVLTLDRAGFDTLGVLAGPHEPALRAALGRRGLTERVVWLAGADDAPALADGQPALVVTGDVLFDVGAFAPLAARAAESRRAVRGAMPGSGLRVVVCPGAVLPALLAEMVGGQRSLAEALPRAGQLDTPAVPVGPGLFVPLDATHPPPVLERALGDDLGRRTAAKDSYLATLIDRRLSRPVTRLFLRWPVTPAQVTLASIALGILGAIGLGTVSYWGRLAGVLALIASIVLDCVDGEIARSRFEQSAAGARLDVMGDYLVHLAVFSGLGIGLYRQGLPPGGGWAAVALVAAVLATTLMLHRLFIGPALGQGGDLHWSGEEEGLRDSPIAAVVEKLASRDYTYLLLILALLGRLEWFLYAAAVGAWVFVGAVLAFWAYQRRPLVLWAYVVMPLRRHRVELGCLALGLAILLATLWHIGLTGLVRDLRLIGWGFGVIVLVETLNVGFNTWGWALAFPAGERTISARRLVAARLAGDAINYLTPSATVGGELLRVRLLGSDVPLGLRWASVSAAKLGQTVAQAVFVLLGLALVLPRLAGVEHAAAWLAGASGALLVALTLAWLIRRGLWATLSDAAGRLGLGAWLPASWDAAGRELDAALLRLGHPRVAASLACFVAGWAVGAAEIYVILWWLGGPVDWQIALALETGSVLIEAVLFFVPAKVGTQEGGKVLLFALLGMDPARGLTVGVVRRIRELVYAGLGLAALGLLTARPAARLESHVLVRSKPS